MTDFTGVAPALSQALAARGYADLTPVQQAMLAPEVAGRDALVSARTGSGKTVAFGLAIAQDVLGDAERMGQADAPLALIVAPTRELAVQVRTELDWLYAPTGAVLASCVGGMDQRTERRALERGAHLVVGTPGRLRDHIGRGALDMTGLRVVVLDEADEMLDLGFREDLEFILAAAPQGRRTLMFSATVPKAIVKLAESYQRDALRLSLAEARAPHADIEHRAYAVAQDDRETAIYNLLRYHDAESALVFCATRAAVAHLSARLSNRGLSVVTLSGELSQTERSAALQAMRDGKARVCVATDVAARGIDLPGLELVVHADLPGSTETLLHRSGRTGRAGRKGVSALIAPARMRRRAESLFIAAGVTATWSAPPAPAAILARDDARILADPLLDAPVSDEERAMVAALLDRVGPERVAAAFLRRLRAGLAAPEELNDATEPEAVRPPREAFGPGTWFRLSVGRKQRAEPRWLLPLICNAGGITRRDVGAIRLEDNVTHVEIAAERAASFLAAIGPERTLDGGVVVTPADGPPSADRPRPGPRSGPRPDSRSDSRSDPRSGPGPTPRPAAYDPTADRPAPRRQPSGAGPARAEGPRPGPRPGPKPGPKPGPRPTGPRGPRPGPR